MRHRRKDFNNNDRKNMARGDPVRESLYPAVKRLRMNAAQMRVGLARAGIMAQAGEGPLQQLGHVLTVVGNIMTLRLSAVGDVKRRWAGSTQDKRFGIARYNLVIRFNTTSVPAIINNVLVGASAKGKTFSYREGAENLVHLAVAEGKPVCSTIGALNVDDAESVLDQLYKMYAGEELLTNFTAAVNITTMSSAEQEVSTAFNLQELLGR